MPKNQADFTQRWAKIFRFGKYEPELCRRHLEALPHPDQRDFPLVDFLFTKLPDCLKTSDDAYIRSAAEAYALFCLACWQGKTAFVPFPQNYAEFLKKALTHKSDTHSPAVRAVVALAGEYNVAGRCGLNAFQFQTPELLAEAERIVAQGAYETYLTARGREKYAEFESRILADPGFKRDWALIQSLYPQQTRTSEKLRRTLVGERSWHTAAGARFDGTPHAFQAVFDLFCWKYCLWAMQGDKPYLMKPSVNITPLGTQIFIPSYLSYDPKRDFDHAKISRLHKSRGVKKQGPAFSESRLRRAELARKAKLAEQAGRRQKLKGDRLMDFIARSLSRPQLDPRAIRELIRKK